MKRFFFGWLVHELKIINYKLDILTSEVDRLNQSMDFSKEDAAVKSMSGKLREATNRIPPRVSPPDQQKGK